MLIYSSVTKACLDSRYPWPFPAVEQTVPKLHGSLPPQCSVKAAWLDEHQLEFGQFNDQSWGLNYESQELCERRGGRPGLHVPNSPYGLCRRKAKLNLN